MKKAYQPEPAWHKNADIIPKPTPRRAREGHARTGGNASEFAVPQSARLGAHSFLALEPAEARERRY